MATWTPTKNQISQSLDAYFGADPRDRAPPPAPKKPRLACAAPTTLIYGIGGYDGSAPNAPCANRKLIVSMYDVPVSMREHAAKQLAATFLPVYRMEKAEFNASDIALDEAIKLTPLALPAGPLKEYLLSKSVMTFEWDLTELWVDLIYKQGVISHVQVNIEKMQANNRHVSSAPPPKVIYRFSVDSLPAPTGGADVSSANGHWEEIGSGKGGKHRFWVEAKAM